VITLLIFGPLVYGTASSALADVATPHAVAVWGPSLALAALVALARWGAIQGPVIFSVADVAQLLGAPLRRGDLVFWRLVRGLAWIAGGAAVVAGVALIGIAGHHRGLAVARGAGFVVAITALGVLGIAGASLVHGSRRWDRWTQLAVWPVGALAVAFVLVGNSGGSERHVALWSGPWGWAIQPVVAGGEWPLALGLLLLLDGRPGCARGPAPRRRLDGAPHASRRGTRRRCRGDVLVQRAVRRPQHVLSEGRACDAATRSVARSLAARVSSSPGVTRSRRSARRRG